MPNIKSAKKRVLVNAKKTEQNKAIRSAVKTEMKKVDLLLKENKLEVVEKFAPISARLIANKASFKFKGDVIEKEKRKSDRHWPNILFV